MQAATLALRVSSPLPLSVSFTWDAFQVQVPFNSMGLNCAGYLYTDFSTNKVGPSHPQGFASMDGMHRGLKTVFFHFQMWIPNRRCKVLLSTHGWLNLQIQGLMAES